jgi:CSLREA domain-containing protein
LAVLLAVLACLLVASPAATAETFTVDSVGDEVDAAPGNEFCANTGGKCTLRAAIEESNSLEEGTRIDFDEEVFEGQASGTITLTGPLPAIAVQAFVNGRSCPPGTGPSGPCVGIEGPGGGTALTAAHSKVKVVGLAIAGAQTAIRLANAPSAELRGNWLGVALDGAIVGNGVGVLVDSGSNGSFVGGEGAKHGNVIAGNAGDGVDVHGGNEVKVLGNYFGVAPDGATLAANGGDDVEVVSIGGSGPVNTSIGARVSGSAAASPLCDGGCNVISGAATDAVDLQGDGGPEAPAEGTAILGNYIGLDAMGASAVPNAGVDVRVGVAANTAIGGPSNGEENRINGGIAAVLAGPAAAGLAVRGNLIGLDAAGAQPLDPPADGILVDSAALPAPSAEAVIARNQIAVEDGVAIGQRGQGAWILDNRIHGSHVGIETAESTAFLGNVIEGNRIEGPAANGILVENDFNEIAGNEVLGAGAAGIRLDGAALPFGLSGNLIGGDSAAEENTIDGSGGAAIEIANLETTDNEVARNRGAGNAGLFIDLIAASPATELGPNRGIEPPAISSATQSAAGGGALKGARVRVFLKQSSAPGELGSFLGEAVADVAGAWQVTFDSPIPAGSFVAATQTDEGDTSELAVSSIGSVVEDGGCAFAGGEECGGGAGAAGAGAAPGGGGTGPLLRPETTILEGRTRHRAARFVFESDRAGSRFLCRLDDKPFDLCRSPKRYRGLRSGRHVFWVRAVDLAGRVDLSPAKRAFVVRG